MSCGNTPSDDKIYRVSIDNKTKHVEMVCIGIASVDSEAEGYYISVDELPEWVQEKVAVLMLCDFKPPVKEVAGVGRRMDRNVYWVYRT